jgi:CheY-like chemotaxis protein
MKECKILIVDDNVDDVEILSEAFQHTGVDSVHHEHTAMKAFIYLEGIHTPAKLPKLIVIDAFLPGISGLLFSRFKKNGIVQGYSSYCRMYFEIGKRS